MAYEKLLNEIYAVVALKYLWSEYKPGFAKDEAPDWINESMGFGMEVSQALLPDDGQTESMLQKYLGCLKEELPTSVFERYGSRLHFYNNRFWAILPPDDEQQDYNYKTIYRFEKKLEKLNTNYRKMQENGLYLFVHPREGENIDAEKVFDEMKQIQADKGIQFERVFLDCVSVIYYCDFRHDSIETIPVTVGAQGFLESEAERLRNGRSWPDGTAFDETEQC